MEILSKGVGLVGIECFSLLDEISDVVIIISDKCLVDFINLSAEKKFGLLCQDAIGKSVFELFSLAGLKSPLQSDYFLLSEKTRVTLGHISWTVSAMPSEDKPCAMLIGKETYNDRDYSIARNLAQVLDCTPGSLYWKDREGRYLGCNKFMVKTSGLNLIEDIVGKTDVDLWPDNAEKIRENDRYVMDTGETVFLEESVEIHAGEVMCFTSVKTPLMDEYNNIVGVIGNSLDITKLKKTESLLKAAKEKAEASNNAKNEFIRNMEHDIRTPFNGVWGLANVLADRETDPEKKDHLSSLASCAKELLDYCDSILDFSRVEHGVTPVLEKTFDLRELLSSIFTIESIAATHKSLALKVEPSHDLPAIIIGDPYRLKCILLNLVSNAIKFTEAGHITLSVSLQKVDVEKRHSVLKFVIEDTGIGIPEEKRNIIYEKFTRVAPSNQGIYKGKGLGLRIVKQFVSELDGDIHLVSKINVGTTFTLLLPFKLPLTDDIVDEN